MKVNQVQFESILNKKCGDKADPNFFKDALQIFIETTAKYLADTGTVQLRGLGTIKYQTIKRGFKKEGQAATKNCRLIKMKTSKKLYKPKLVLEQKK